MRIHCNDCGQIHNAKDPCPKPDRLKKAVETLSKPKQTKARNPIKMPALDRLPIEKIRSDIGTPVNVRFSDDLLAKLDKERGPLNRQDMIRKLVEDL